VIIYGQQLETKDIEIRNEHPTCFSKIRPQSKSQNAIPRFNCTHRYHAKLGQQRVCGIEGGAKRTSSALKNRLSQGAQN
jgi:hypothetical protein